VRCTLTGISLYPIKALGRCGTQQSQVSALGLVGDRRWVLTDTTGKFISQRSHPKLAQVQVRTLKDGLELKAPGADPILLSPSAEAPRSQVTVWQDTVSAVDAPSFANEWFSLFLGDDCLLHFMDEQCIRPVNMPEGQPGQHRVSFADGFPCLLASTASLDLLNSKLVEPVGMDRFRPNLVVTGCEAHAEDDWGRFRIGEAEFRAVKPCSRCKVPTIDQTTGKATADGEPLRTLATYRNQPEGIMFGVNLVVENEGVLSVGDEVLFLD